MLDHQSVQVAWSRRILDTEITVMVQGLGTEVILIAMQSPYRVTVIDTERERTRSMPDIIVGLGEHGPDQRASRDQLEHVEPDGSKVKNQILPILIGTDITYDETLEEPV